MNPALYLFSKEPYESSKGKPVDGVLSAAPGTERKCARWVADTKFINAHAKELGHQEVPELMHHNKRHEYSDNKKYVHSCNCTRKVPQSISDYDVFDVLGFACYFIFAAD